MKLNLSRYFVIVILAIVGMGCSSSGGDDSPPPTGGNDDDPVIPDPSAATLIFPEDNTECTTGVVNPNNTALSTITFEWNASANTDSYTVTLTNLNTNSSFFTNASTNAVDIAVERGTPFSWFVTSRAQGTSVTANSATFRFYNEGPGIENYAPFPAEAVNPARGANISAAGTVTLEWSGTDIDGDLADFEVFFDADVSDPTTSIGTTVETSLSDVPITSGTTYFWRVVSTDSAGNSSTSEVFQFRVN